MQRRLSERQAPLLGPVVGTLVRLDVVMAETGGPIWGTFVPDRTARQPGREHEPRSAVDVQNDVRTGILLGVRQVVGWQMPIDRLLEDVEVASRQFSVCPGRPYFVAFCVKVSDRLGRGPPFILRGDHNVL